LSSSVLPVRNERVMSITDPAMVQKTLRDPT
jgi:hypothetical protein